MHAATISLSVQRDNSELAGAGESLRHINDGLQLQLAELANSSKSRDAVAADTRSQLEHIYRPLTPSVSARITAFCFELVAHFICRSRIDLLQREVSDLNSKLIAAASRPSSDDSAAEWAPYFQAAQRDHAQKIQVCNECFQVLG